MAKTLTKSIKISSLDCNRILLQFKKWLSILQRYHVCVLRNRRLWSLRAKCTQSANSTKWLLYHSLHPHPMRHKRKTSISKNFLLRRNYYALLYATTVSLHSRKYEHEGRRYTIDNTLFNLFLTKPPIPT